MTCKIFFMRISLFTLGRKKSLKRVQVFTYCLKTCQKKAKSWFYIPSKSIHTSSSIVTLPTLIIISFNYWLYVTCKITFRSSYKITLVTVILDFFMYKLYVTYKINLCSSSIFTLVTLILSSFMYLLYVTCKIFFMRSSLFTLGRKKSLKRVQVYTYYLKTCPKQANKGLQYQ